MDRIEDILNERGLSKAAFAELMGTSRQNVNALLKNPTRAKLEEIAAALEVPVWQLFASPEEVVSQEFIAFFYHKGRTHTPTTMDEVMDILKAWNKTEFHKLCQSRFFTHLDEEYWQNADIMKLRNDLCTLLNLDCEADSDSKNDY